MKPCNVFLIVDMQYPFVMRDSDGAFIRAVVEATQAARSRGDHIMLLEDHGGSITHGEILTALQGYSSVSRLHKGQWDGSLQVEMELTTLQLDPQRITTCGAFAEQCVISTLVGLRHRFPAVELEVLRKACVAAPTQRYSESDWKQQGRRLSLKLV